MTLSIAAGIDAGQKYLDVGFAPSGKGFRVPNASAGIARIVTRLAEAGVRRVVLEAIGPMPSAWSRRSPLPASRSAWSTHAASRRFATPKAGAPRPTGWTPI
jgi:hypothetical protein